MFSTILSMTAMAATDAAKHYIISDAVALATATARCPFTLHDYRQ